VFDIIFYIRLIAGVCFLISGIAFLKRKKEEKRDISYLLFILCILGGVLQFIGALAYLLDKTG
jgi:Ca2+/Na+ antiporter